MLVGLILGFYGSVIGSFAGVCSMRIAQRQSFYWGRSQCEHCQRQLKWYELFPLFSFLYLKGCCRTCRQAIPKEIFMFELFFAMLLPYLLLTGNRSWQMIIFQLLLALILIVLAYIDLKIQIVPNQAHLWLLCLFFLNYHGIESHMKGSLIIFLPLLILSLITNEGIGGGDIKLLGTLGFILGEQAILEVFSYAVLLSLPVAIYVKFLKKIEGIPFVPFIAMGTCIYLLNLNYDLKMYG